MSISSRWGAVLCVTVAGALALAAVALAGSDPKTVSGSQVKVQPRTLRLGTSAPSRSIVGNRVFVDASHGFALVQRGQAQYMAATRDGGSNWRTASPALHLDAAQAPLAVSEIGAAGIRTAYAFGSQAVDLTTNGGRTWTRALFSGLVAAVVPGMNGHLVAFVQDAAGAPVRQYMTRNGGRTWTQTSALAGG